MSSNDPSDTPDSTARVDPSDAANDEQQLRRQLEQLGFTQPVFRDESLAPEVDQDVLRALVRRELPDETAALVFRLIYSFRSWNDAHAQMLIQEYKSEARQDDGLGG